MSTSTEHMATGIFGRLLHGRKLAVIRCSNRELRGRLEGLAELFKEASGNEEIPDIQPISDGELEGLHSLFSALLEEGGGREAIAGHLDVVFASHGVTAELIAATSHR